MELPKIRKHHYKDFRYIVGRDGRGGQSLAKTKMEAIKLWFWYLTRII